jgi:hypothetical protein
MNEDNERLGDDILHGVRAIAEFIGEKEGECRWHIGQGHYDAAIFRLPGTKLIRGRKSAFRELLRPGPGRKSPMVRKAQSEVSAP